MAFSRQSNFLVTQLKKGCVAACTQVDGPAAPYRQSERSDVYVKIAKKLVELVSFSSAETLKKI